jgi:hypothetical protein
MGSVWKVLHTYWPPRSPDQPISAQGPGPPSFRAGLTLLAEHQLNGSRISFKAFAPKTISLQSIFVGERRPQDARFGAGLYRKLKELGLDDEAACRFVR